jgi:hypothetical protein
MRTLTYPVGQKLSTFTSTKQLVVALRTAIEGLVFLFIALKVGSPEWKVRFSTSSLLNIKLKTRRASRFVFSFLFSL